MTDDETASILRLQGIEDTAIVRRAHLEPNGMVSVLRRDGEEAKLPPPAAL
jgi:uncharacterized membrane protein YcaP (DUF421 family)